jgi:hypothetical protein
MIAGIVRGALPVTLCMSQIFKIDKDADHHRHDADSEQSESVDNHGTHSFSNDSHVGFS